MTDTKPCLGCTKRSPACHDRCETFAAWSAEHQKMKKWLKENDNTLLQFNLVYRKNRGGYCNPPGGINRRERIRIKEVKGQP